MAAEAFSLAFQVAKADERTSYSQFATLAKIQAASGAAESATKWAMDLKIDELRSRVLVGIAIGLHEFSSDKRK
jgi:phage I-like protein